MKEVDLENYKKTLEEFLKNYIKYTDHISYYRPSNWSDEIRTWLQRKTNLVDLIINRVHYEPDYTIKGQTYTFYSVLASTLQEGANKDQLWKEIKAHVIRIINEGIGNIENNTIILKEIEPVIPIKDETLRKRCLDLLKAPGSFDRVIN